ncbi:MAG: hypothetical protein ACI8TP_003298 [Acidimicrobiales bacterium]|jgi:hypothetical protein
MVVSLAVLASLLAPSPPVAAQEVRSIVFPVHPASSHLVDWSDTFGAPRGSSRSHIGVDILGERMIPLVAVADGEVTWLRHDADRGNNLEITDSEGWAYHYVHINNDTPGTDDGSNAYEFAFAPGIVNGSEVQAGQVVAFMGDSGNAEGTAPHLHFEIERPDGTAINPTPSVDAAFARLATFPELDTDQLGPYSSAEALLDDVFNTLVGRSPSADETNSFGHAVDQSGLAAALAPYVGSESLAAEVDRLYVAYFLRLPDFEGYQYWIDRRSSDLGLIAMADHFAGSPEFEERYGHLDFGAFLDQLYVDVLGRTPDEEGKTYWLDRLSDADDTVTRGTIVAFFTDSVEMRALAEHRSELVASTALFDDRMPTGDEIAAWEAQRSIEAMVDSIASRFLD